MTDKLNGYLSEKNSNRTPLTGGATFTGQWEDCRNYDTISFALKADQTCTLYADFTSDPTFANTDSTLTYKIAANINEVHRLTITRPFFRLRVVNDSVAQTYFSLSTMVGSHPQLSAPINLTLGLDADATAVRPTIPQDEILIGKRAGVSYFTKFGYRGGLTAANGEETIWAATGNFTILTSASTFTITYNSSTDGSDAGATGAKTLYFQYVDANGLDAVASHTLSDTGSDVTSFTGLGINRISVASSGSATYNNNDITVTATTGGTIQGFIPAAQSVTQQCIFHTDSNSFAVAKYLFIQANKISGGGSPRVTVKGYVYNRNVATRYEIFRTTIDTASDTQVVVTEPVGFRLTPTDVLYFVADTDTNNTDITLRFSLVEYKID